MHRFLRPIVVIALLGCGDATTPGQPPEFTVSPTAQWSGGTVTVRSAFFRDRDSLHLIRAGVDTAIPIRVDDSTVAFMLPVGPSGPVELEWVNGDRYEAMGLVDRVGQAARVEVPGGPTTNLVVTLRGDSPLFLGANDADTLIIVDPLAGTATSTGLRTPGGYYGPGITHRGDRFLLRDATDSLKVWQLWPSPQAIAVPPLYRTGFLRLGAQLSDSTWLFAQSHSSRTVGPGALSGLPVEDPWLLIMSPRGDRLAVVAIGTDLAGLPVFDAATGDTAFTIAGIRHLVGADFSPDGATLYLVGRSVSGVPPDSLLVLDATVGTRLQGVALPDSFTPLTVSSDHGFDRVFVHGRRACGPSVVVYQASTLTVEGELHGDGALASCTGVPWNGATAVDRTRQRLYVLWQGVNGLNSLWTFDLLP